MTMARKHLVDVETGVQLLRPSQPPARSRYREVAKTDIGAASSGLAGITIHWPRGFDIELELDHSLPCLTVMS